MTREQAFEAVRALSRGLDGPDDDARVSRLFERISASEEPELLRLVLAELGARAVLSGEAARSAAAILTEMREITDRLSQSLEDRLADVPVEAVCEDPDWPTPA